MAVSFRIDPALASGASDPTTLNPGTDPSTDDILFVPIAESNSSVSTEPSISASTMGGTWTSNYSQKWASRRWCRVYRNNSWTTATGTATVDFVNNQDKATGMVIVSGASASAIETSVNSGSASGTSYTPTLTDGLGGYLVFIQMEDTVSISAPTGWTKQAQVTQASGLRSLAVFTHPAGTLPDTTPSFTWSGTNGYAGIAYSFTAAASGTTGSGAPTLVRVTGAGSGSTGTTGSGSPTLVRVAGVGSGSTGNTGTSATTLVRVAGSGVGSTGNTGSGAPTLVRVTSIGSGSTGTTGTSATTLVRVTGAGSGSTGTTGSSATTLVRVTGAGSGSTTAPGATSGSGAPTLTRHTPAGSGSTTLPTITGTGSPTLARSTAAGSGSTGTTGSGSPTCTRHTAGGVGSTGLNGTAAVALIRHTLAGSGSTTSGVVTGSGSPTLTRHTALGLGTGTPTEPVPPGRNTVVAIVENTSTVSLVARGSAGVTLISANQPTVTKVSD